jgi:hypothetical protein
MKETPTSPSSHSKVLPRREGCQHLSKTSCTIAVKLNLLADTIVKCTVCTLKVSNNQDKYCLYHKQAYDNLTKHYEIWNKAFGGLSWTNYMNKILELKETGSWVKEVISAELKTAT